jgi:hypothetical protein
MEHVISTLEFFLRKILKHKLEANKFKKKATK